MTITNILNRDIDIMNRSTYLAKETLGETLPYELVSSMFQHQPTVIFTKHFEYTFRQSLSNGCMSKMSYMEEELLYTYIRFQNICMKYEAYYIVFDVNYDVVGISDKMASVYGMNGMTNFDKKILILAYLNENSDSVLRYDKLYLEDPNNSTLIKIKDYIDILMLIDIGPEYMNVISALDTWISDELQCIPHVELNYCFDLEHSWSKCSDEQ